MLPIEWYPDRQVLHAGKLPLESTLVAEFHTEVVKIPLSCFGQDIPIDESILLHHVDVLPQKEDSQIMA